MLHFKAFISVVLMTAIHFTCFADTNNASSEQLTSQWIDSLKSGSASELPLAEGVSFYGSLLPAPINGQAKVVAFLNRVTTSIQKVEVISINTRQNGACVEMVFSFKQMPGESIEEVHCLNVSEGKIESIRLYFDPRPFLEKTTAN